MLLLSANKNYLKIDKQIKKYRPSFFLISDHKTYEIIKEKYKNDKIKIINNIKNFRLNKKIDITISAIPGIVGLFPTLFILKLSKKMLLANKESIICGWNLILRKSQQYSTKLIPIDSEHFSIFKLIENHKINEIKKIFITASGGPFLNMKKKIK